MIVSTAINVEMPEVKNEKQSVARLGKLKILWSPLMIIGVLLIVYASFGVIYFQQRSECSELNPQVVRSRGIVQKPLPSFDVDKLQARLAKTEAAVELKSKENANLLMALPRPEHGVDIYSALVALGQELDSGLVGGDIAIRNIKTAAIIERADGITVLPYEMTVEGSRDALFDFISRLTQAEGPLRGVEITDIAIKMADIITDASDVPHVLTLAIHVQTWEDSVSVNAGTSVIFEGEE